MWNCRNNISTLSRSSEWKADSLQLKSLFIFETQTHMGQEDCNPFAEILESIKSGHAERPELHFTNLHKDCQAEAIVRCSLRTSWSLRLVNTIHRKAIHNINYYLDHQLEITISKGSPRHENLHIEILSLKIRWIFESFPSLEPGARRYPPGIAQVPPKYLLSISKFAGTK